MGLFRSSTNCWRCGMRRVGNRRFCAACDADLEAPPQPDRLSARFPAARRADGRRPFAGSQARRVGPPRLEPEVWPTSRPVRAAVSRSARGPASGSGGRFAGLLASLDPASRRTIVRLGAELAVLVGLAVLIYGGAIMRGGAGGSPTLPPSNGSGTLGISEADVATVFSVERFGGFTFKDATPIGGVAHRVATSNDGLSRLDLAGDPRDLRRITLQLQVRDGVMDGAQQRHAATLLALFAPDTLEPMLAAMRSAVDRGEDANLVARQGRIAVLLVVGPPYPNAVAISLTPSTSDG